LHLKALSELSDMLQDEDALRRIRRSTRPDQVTQIARTHAGGIAEQGL
jgi:mannitol/fructose-specific phosphotransferase system IIA component (Ntr-type)